MRHAVMIALLATAVRAQDTEGKRDMRAGFPAPDPALTWMQDPHHAQGGLLAHSTAPAAVTAAAAAFPRRNGYHGFALACLSCWLAAN